MWLKWTSKKVSRSVSERPVFWWRQLEAEPRSALPFAHLFPQPPVSRRTAPNETQRLVGELVAADPPERMEEIVEAYQHRPPMRHWEPVKVWQILSAHRVEDDETAAWGEDGGQIVDWFDRGELMHAYPTEPIPQMAVVPATRGIGRAVAWLKKLMQKPDSLELVGAEF